MEGTCDVYYLHQTILHCAQHRYCTIGKYPNTYGSDSTVGSRIIGNGLLQLEILHCCLALLTRMASQRPSQLLTGIGRSPPLSRGPTRVLRTFPAQIRGFSYHVTACCAVAAIPMSNLDLLCATCVERTAELFGATWSRSICWAQGLCRS